MYPIVYAEDNRRVTYSFEFDLSPYASDAPDKFFALADLLNQWWENEQLGKRRSPIERKPYFLAVPYHKMITPKFYKILSEIISCEKEINEIQKKYMFKGNGLLRYIIDGYYPLFSHFEDLKMNLFLEYYDNVFNYDNNKRKDRHQYPLTDMCVPDMAKIMVEKYPPEDYFWEFSFPDQFFIKNLKEYFNLRDSNLIFVSLESGWFENEEYYNVDENGDIPLEGSILLGKQIDINQANLVFRDGLSFQIDNYGLFFYEDEDLIEPRKLLEHSKFYQQLRSSIGITPYLKFYGNQIFDPITMSFFKIDPNIYKGWPDLKLPG